MLHDHHVIFSGLRLLQTRRPAPHHSDNQTSEVHAIFRPRAQPNANSLKRLLKQVFGLVLTFQVWLASKNQRSDCDQPLPSRYVAIQTFNGLTYLGLVS
ncbi:Uncharacterised protein [Burkholderia pseudomallei]|nr:Uncharacterised protein [Burkholderia pseudomallei]CAJ3103970.1 Uncharacterised protein [Burkholderia pseudomallei]CAJ3124132.1 Uncharacterised protein [Burkholderia pseudomallei]CAJ3160462.1 Uncharacterised protein [Burkholderia pseudomallei]CAJ3324580.1 Uncharacterised protein [Burkholderia pseudomallei]